MVSTISRKHDADWSARLFSAQFVLQFGWRVVTIPTQSRPSRRPYSGGKNWCELIGRYSDSCQSSRAELTVICVCAPEIVQGGCGARCRMPNVSLLRRSAVARLRRLKGNRDLETCYREEHPYDSRASMLDREPGLERQVNGTVHVGNSEISGGKRMLFVKSRLGYI